jgi:hypothetical protein
VASGTREVTAAVTGTREVTAAVTGAGARRGLEFSDERGGVVRGLESTRASVTRVLLRVPTGVRDKRLEDRMNVGRWARAAQSNGELYN